MPVQNSNFKISARPDLATDLFQILIPATFNSLLYQKGKVTLQLCPRSFFLRGKYLVVIPGPYALTLMLLVAYFMQKT